MKTKLIGLIASVALMGSGTALAGGDWKKHDKQQQTQSQDATGGSGQVTEGTAGQQGSMQHQGSMQQQGSTQQLGANELSGRVVKASKKMVWIEHAGAIVPLTINKDTQFADPNLKRAQDIKAGDEIRASFEVKQTDNVATNIQLGGGTGGSGPDVGDTGSDVQLPDPFLNKDTHSLPPAPIQDSTGGSGSDLTPPDISSEGTGSDLGSDTSKTGDY
jgi:hypothetical protein